MMLIGYANYMMLAELVMCVRYTGISQSVVTLSTVHSENTFACMDKKAV